MSDWRPSRSNRDLPPLHRRLAVIVFCLTAILAAAYCVGPRSGADGGIGPHSAYAQPSSPIAVPTPDSQASGHDRPSAQNAEYEEVRECLTRLTLLTVAAWITLAVGVIIGFWLIIPELARIRNSVRRHELRAQERKDFAYVQLTKWLTRELPRIVTRQIGRPTMARGASGTAKQTEDEPAGREMGAAHGAGVDLEIAVPEQTEVAAAPAAKPPVEPAAEPTAQPTAQPRKPPSRRQRSEPAARKEAAAAAGVDVPPGVPAGDQPGPPIGLAEARGNLKSVLDQYANFEPRGFAVGAAARLKEEFGSCRRLQKACTDINTEVLAEGPFETAEAAVPVIESWLPRWDKEILAPLEQLARNLEERQSPRQALRDARLQLLRAAYRALEEHVNLREITCDHGDPFEQDRFEVRDRRRTEKENLLGRIAGPPISRGYECAFPDGRVVIRRASVTRYVGSSWLEGAVRTATAAISALTPVKTTPAQEQSQPSEEAVAAESAAEEAPATPETEPTEAPVEAEPEEQSVGARGEIATGKAAAVAEEAERIWTDIADTSREPTQPRPTAEQEPPAPQPSEDAEPERAPPEAEMPAVLEEQRVETTDLALGEAEADGEQPDEAPEPPADSEDAAEEKPPSTDDDGIWDTIG